MKSLTLTSAQVLDALSRLENIAVPASTLADWARTGLVAPSVAWPRKRGRAHPRVYNLSDLARLRVVVRLRAAGISMGRVAAVLSALDAKHAQVFKPNTTVSVVVSGYQVSVVQGTERVDVPSGQVWLPLRDVMEGNAEVAAAVAA